MKNLIISGLIGVIVYLIFANNATKELKIHEIKHDTVIRIIERKVIKHDTIKVKKMVNNSKLDSSISFDAYSEKFSNQDSIWISFHYPDNYFSFRMWQAPDTLKIDSTTVTQIKPNSIIENILSFIGGGFVVYLISN